MIGRGQLVVGDTPTTGNGLARRRIQDNNATLGADARLPNNLLNLEPDVLNGLNHFFSFNFT